MIKFACPGCQAAFSVGDDKAGKTGKCPKCASQFVIPTPEVSATPPQPPTPLPPSMPPPQIHNEFAFGNDEAPKPMKGKTPSKTLDTPKKRVADDDDDQDDVPRQDDGDDDDRYDDDQPVKKKAGAGENKTWTLIAGILHCIVALQLLVCGVGYTFSGYCTSIVGNTFGSCFGAAATMPTTNIKTVGTTTGIGTNRTFTMTTQNLTPEEQKIAKETQKSFGDAQKTLDNISTHGKVMMGVGICMILVGLLAIPAAIGCFMRMPFGRYLSFVCGPAILLLQAVNFISMVALLSDLGTTSYGVGCGFSLGYLVYTGLTVFAAVKGFPQANSDNQKKKNEDMDADEEDEDEPEPEVKKPAPKPKRRDPEEDEEDDRPKPKKKRVVEEDDEDDDPHPRKKKRRNDDDD